jgi:hypothetical protein
VALVEEEDDDENEDDNGKRREAVKRRRETWKNLGDGASPSILYDIYCMML